MKKNVVFTLVFAIVLSLTGTAQFGIQRSIRSKYAKEGKEHAQKEADKGTDKVEDKGMEEADKGLDKATDAAEPGIEKAEEGEEYGLFGVSKYNEFVDGYEADVASKEPADYKKYRFETAIVEYAVEGHEEGTKTLYIDMGGYKVAEYITIKKKKSEEKTAAILYGADIISIDFDEQQAVKMHNPMAYYLANPNRDWEETGEILLTKLGFKKTGTETIIGKECDVWKNGKHRIWVWDGLTLKSADGKDIETATDLKIDTKVPEERFEVPKGFEYEIIGAEDLFPEIDEEEVKAAMEEEDDEISDEMLDKIENMSYSEFKVWARELDPDMNDEEMKQSYLYLRQKAKARH